MTEKIEKVKFTTSIERDLVGEIKKQAIDENRSVSDILNELIRQYLRSKGVNV